MSPETSPAQAAPAPAGRGCVLVVEDETALARAVARSLQQAGFEAHTRGSGLEAMAALEGEPALWDAVLSDLSMPEMDGLALLQTVRGRWPDIPVVIMTANADLDTAVDLMRQGAYDYLVKASSRTIELSAILDRAVERRRLVLRARALERQVDVSRRFDDLVGDCPGMRQVYRQVESAAPTDMTALVMGESGTGKELVARAIHCRSARRAAPFLPVNCAGLGGDLLESELFGHVRGAFTGAVGDRRGVFEEASGGTLLLDEVGELPAATQASLLRVLQDGEIRPVGSSRPRRVDVRLIAATNRDLAASVRTGTFREDLYYRLNVLTIRVPPLRERREDIPALVRHFLHKHSARAGKKVTAIDPQVMERFLQYDWPGNVRELENAVQRALVMTPGDTLAPAALPTVLARAVRPTPHPGTPQLCELPFSEAKEAAVRSFERHYLETVLARTGGNVGQAARLAGLDPANLRRILDRLAIDPAVYRRRETGSSRIPGRG